MRLNVLIVGAMYHPEAEELLERHFAVTRVEPEELAASPALRTAHGLAVRYPTQITAEIFDAAPELVAVLSSGRGVDNIDIAAASKAGVVVANNPGLGGRPVSEHALGLLLSVTRDLGAVARDGMPGAWEKRLSTRRVELGGKTLGIVGCGNVGGWMARRASAGFLMNVLAYDPYVSAETIAGHGATKVDDLHEMLAASDVVSCHPELNDETENMFDDDMFARMKRGAYFLNTSRGAVVDTAALVRALRSGHLAGAALDVYDQEPPPSDSPLLGIDRLVLSAHVADFTVETKHALAMSGAGQLVTALSGEAPPHALNPEIWGPASARLTGILASTSAHAHREDSR
ncbi:D-3-phosphoglycerate dehydrogenase [Micromonospora nigra]|uniref:D-3-phosphoglycerate dehydrogenase n=1 Tax=Micromonospora nigra TaxID=145857 RepID=A0A1C6RCZ1_9ACTN|nr:hydroxyacid dehydrogenase [Micromonospora nigra]SCL14964.1 D-3-phosphoglycerate dehydrogenase [Micromonospora nigra]